MMTKYKTMHVQPCVYIKQLMTEAAQIKNHNADIQVSHYECNVE